MPDIFAPAPAAAIYAGLRVIAGVLFGIVLWRERQRPVVNVAQGVADLCAVLFVLGLTSLELRTSVGQWWMVLFLYTAMWEIVQFRGRIMEFMEPPAGDTSAVTFEGAAERVGCVVFLAWEVFAVAIPLAAGFGLAFDAAAPNNLTFPKG